MTTQAIVEDLLEDTEIASKNCNLLKIAFPKEEGFYPKKGEVSLGVGIDEHTGLFGDYKGNTFFLEIVNDGKDSYEMRCWENGLRLSEKARANLHNSVYIFARYFFDNE
jgi:outer membrane scaffolding protein for murein synthesis (MipA/OmpV family)